MAGLCGGGNEPATSVKNLVLKMKTQQSTRMKAPKPMQLVISAIKDLREPEGPTPKKIAKYIMSRYSTDASKLQRQVNTALKRGVTWGILRTARGRYQLEDLDDGSQHMRSHRRRRRSPSGSRHRRVGRRGSSRRRRRRSSSGRRCRSGGRRRRSCPSRRRRRSRRRLPIKKVKNDSK
ncbi:hypothetical protein ANN_13395 [Periplaneta americana]|uniref:H15 domain-containing protein n=1 Tax=Periplaneta americana TaxID=6978 RepID=A0ABQ8TJB2_PERAM|nr:hypothetical protein ANN_13395 [Periplaneta americana]